MSKSQAFLRRQGHLELEGNGSDPQVPDELPHVPRNRSVPGELGVEDSKVVPATMTLPVWRSP